MRPCEVYGSRVINLSKARGRVPGTGSFVEDRAEVKAQHKLTEKAMPNRNLYGTQYERKLYDC